MPSSDSPSKLRRNSRDISVSPGSFRKSLSPSALRKGYTKAAGAPLEAAMRELRPPPLTAVEQEAADVAANVALVAPSIGGAAPAIGNSPILEATSAAARVLQSTRSPAVERPGSFSRSRLRSGSGSLAASVKASTSPPAGPKSSAPLPPISPLAPAATGAAAARAAGSPPPPSPAPPKPAPAAEAPGAPSSRLWLGERSQMALRVAVVVAAVVTVLVFPAVYAFEGPVGPGGFFALLWITDVFLWLDVAAGFVALPPPERADHAVNPSATPPSHRAVVRRRLRSPMLMEDVLCRFPYDLFACAGRGAPFAFGAGHIARLLLLRRAWAIVANRFESLERRRFVGSGTRLAMLGGVSLVGLHLYACVTWLVSASLAADLRPSWLAVQAAGEAAGQHPMEWPSWAKYVRSLDRALLIVTGEGRRGDTHEEVAIGFVGLLGGTVFLAYFTSTMVQLVANLNLEQEAAAAKIGRVETFCKGSKLPAEVSRRIRAHTCHP